MPGSLFRKGFRRVRSWIALLLLLGGIIQGTHDLLDAGHHFEAASVAAICAGVSDHGHLSEDQSRPPRATAMDVAFKGPVEWMPAGTGVAAVEAPPPEFVGPTSLVNIRLNC